MIMSFLTFGSSTFSLNKLNVTTVVAFAWVAMTEHSAKLATGASGADESF